jgi:hypothetical protein
MKAKLLLRFAVCTLACSACSNKTVIRPLDVENEIIKLSSFKRIETSSMPESIIKNVRYVKLDGSSEDIQFKDIHILKMTNNRIFILDAILRKLVVFDSTGAGLGKVGSRGQGPGEYTRIHDFCVSDAGDVYLKDGTRGRRKLFGFDKDFKLISEQSLPFGANYVQRLTNNKFLFALSSWNKENNASSQIVITDNRLKTEKSYLQFDDNVDENFVIGVGTFTSFGDRILYHRTIDNYVYEFSKEGEPLKSYFFDFGNKDVPNHVRKNIEDNWEEIKRYSCISNIVLINDKYIAGILFEEQLYKPFVADRIENCLYILSGHEEGIRGILWCYDNNLVYSIAPGYEDQSDDLPQDVKSHLANENFILCLNELK